MPRQDDYRVSLDSFEGPLDLLLHLVRQSEVDITDVSIALITDQYLAFLKEIDEIDIEEAGEFLVMAATLVEMKSRSLLPSDKESVLDQDLVPTGDVQDPCEDLVRQLIDYQRFRTASEHLRACSTEAGSRLPLHPGRTSSAGSDETAVEIDLEDARATDLVDAYEHIMRTIDFDHLGDHIVAIDDTPVEIHQDFLLGELEQSTEGCLSLQSFMVDRSLYHRVGLFSATLELVRLRRITILQDNIDEEIQLVLLDPSEALIVESDDISTTHPSHPKDPAP